MKIFPIFPKKSISGAGGSPAVITIGYINQAITNLAGTLAPQVVGYINQALSWIASLTVGTGTQNQALSASAVGSQAQSLGGQNQATTVVPAGTVPAPMGSEGQSFSASSSALCVGIVQSGTAVSGSVAWGTPGNITAADSSNASWTKSEGVGQGAGATDSGLMTAATPKAGTTPAGWTRAKVELQLNWTYNAAGFLLGDSASFTIQPRKADGTAEGSLITVMSRTTNGSAGLTVTTFDITSAVSGLTDADLQAMKFDLTATFSRTLAAAGTRTWAVGVDWLGLRITYTRSSIT